MSEVIKTKNLSFAYEKGRNILTDVSISIESGSINVLIGKNGCGKSTLIDCIIGYNRINSDSVLINGKRVACLSPRQLAEQIAYIPQTTVSDVDFNVLDFILFGRNCKIRKIQTPSEDDINISVKSAEKCGINHLLRRSICKLSGGERQLAYIARALAQDSPIIIMDEPLSSLDLSNQKIVLETIKAVAKDGKTILMSSHDPNIALYLKGNVFLMADGQIVNSGNADEIITVDNLTKIYGKCICNSKKAPYDGINLL